MIFFQVLNQVGQIYKRYIFTQHIQIEEDMRSYLQFEKDSSCFEISQNFDMKTVALCFKSVQLIFSYP